MWVTAQHIIRPRLFVVTRVDSSLSLEFRCLEQLISSVVFIAFSSDYYDCPVSVSTIRSSLKKKQKHGRHQQLQEYVWLLHLHLHISFNREHDYIDNHPPPFPILSERKWNCFSLCISITALPTSHLNIMSIIKGTSDATIFSLLTLLQFRMYVRSAKLQFLQKMGTKEVARNQKIR